MSHASMTIAGTVYTFRHLDPFTLECHRANGEPYRVKVVFGVHTFTEKWTEHHATELLVMDGTIPRAFCLNRYNHSQGLAAAVRQAAGGRVLNNGGRMLICAALPGLVGPYLVAIKLRRGKPPRHDAILTVVSAHARPNLNGNHPSAPFVAVVGGVITGNKPRWK